MYINAQHGFMPGRLTDRSDRYNRKSNGCRDHRSCRLQAHIADGDAKGCRASRIARTSANRSSGDRASARSMIAASSPGMSARLVRISTCFSCKIISN
jgi:hypothetical protein